MSLKTNYFTVKIKKAILSNSIISSVIRNIKLPFWRLFLGRNSKSVNLILKKDIKKIFVVALYGGIGDSILSIPAIKALKKKYIDAKITLLARPLPKSIAERWSFIDEIIVYDERDYKGLRAKLKFLKFLRNQNFDMTINLLFDSVSSALITFFSNATHIVGFDTGVLGLFYNRTVNPPKGDHITDLWLKLMQAVNVEIPEERNFEICISKEEKAYADSIIGKYSDDYLLITMHPGARAIDIVEKRLPPDKYAELANRIQKKYKAKIVLIGAPGEEKLGEIISAQMNPKPIVTIGQTTVRQMMAIVQKSDLLICNNSGPLHVAVALDISTISFVGGADLERFHPYGNPDIHKVIKGDNIYSYNYRSEHLDRISLEAISVEDVLNVVDKQLETLPKFLNRKN